MARDTLSTASVEYVSVPFTGDGDLTAAPVKIAFVYGDDRAPLAEEWLTATNVGGSAARVLVGPGHYVLAPGEPYVWVQITDTPEIPVIRAGRLYVTA